jgi:hypothetical protein
MSAYNTVSLKEKRKETHVFNTSFTLCPLRCTPDHEASEECLSEPYCEYLQQSLQKSINTDSEFLVNSL